MKRKWNNVLSWLLTMVMLVTSFEGFSIPVLADGEEASVSVAAISSDDLTAEGENNGSAADKALSVSVNEGEALTLRFKSAVLSANDLTPSEDKVVSWNIVSANGADADEALAALGFTAAADSTNGNIYVVSSDEAVSGNATFKLTASYNGAEPAEQSIYFEIVVNAKEVTAPEPEEPEETGWTVKAISANGFDPVDGKDGNSPANALSVSVSLNETVELIFQSGVVSGDTVSSDYVSWSLTDSEDAAKEVPAGFEKKVSENKLTISGSSAVSINESYKLTASFNGAEEVIYFSIIAEDEEEVVEPEKAIAISANGFDDNTKEATSSENALTVTVSTNSAVNVSISACVVSDNKAVLSENEVNFTLSANGIALEDLGLKESISENVFAISGNAAASANALYKLTISSNGVKDKEVYINIVVEDETETSDPVVSKNSISVNVTGVDPNAKDGKTAESAYTVTVSNNEAINVSFNAVSVSADGAVLSENSISFNLVSANGVSANLLEGLNGTASGNVYTVSGAVAASSNGAYKLVVTDGDVTEDVYFTIYVGEQPKPVDPVDPVKPGYETGIAIEGIDEDGYDYTGSQIKPAFTVVDCDSETVLAEKTDYTVKYGKNKEGSGTITVKGKGNYTGSIATVTFTINKPDATAATTSVKSIKKVDKTGLVYTGEAVYPKSIVVKTGDGDITMTLGEDGEYTSNKEGKTVVLTFSNNVNKGTATVAATGSDGKTKKKSFSIKAAQLPTANDAYEAVDAVYAAKGISFTTINGTFNDNDICLGKDFKVKKMKADNGVAEVTLKGNGNFTGTATVKFDYAPLELSDENVAVNVVPGKKINASSVTITDGNGVKIPAKALKVTCSNTGKLNAGEAVTVTVAGANEKNIGSADLTFTVGKAKKAKASFVKGCSVEYTGKAVEKSDLEDKLKMLTINGKAYSEDDYEITGLLKNTKKGTMTVVIQGKNADFSGVTTAKIKITAKKMVNAK